MNTWQRLKKHPELWNRYLIRERVINAIRKFFQDQNFHEIEPTYLSGSLPPESFHEVFQTTLLDRNRKQTNAYLPTSPEPFLKKLLSAGIGNCFCLSKAFRNTESGSQIHNPEFTILEWYRINCDYFQLMDDCEKLLKFVFASIFEASHQNFQLKYQNNLIDLSGNWERLSMCDVFRKYAMVDLKDVLNLKDIRLIAKRKGYHVGPNDTWENIFNQIFLNEIEPHLGQGKPIIIYDFPVQLAALSRKKTDDPEFSERFEFYIGGMELGDAYTELTDWREQEQRFSFEQNERQRLGKTIHPIDMDFNQALKLGLPESAGIAVGVDRLIMLFTNSSDISDTMFFPARDLFP